MKDSELKKVVNEWCAKVISETLESKYVDLPQEIEGHENKFKLMAGVVAEGLLSRNNRDKKD